MSRFEEVPLSKIKLDVNNPRIANIIEKYGDNVSAEAIALALGAGGSDEGNSTSFDTLKESIRVYGGVINPIVLNKISDNEYVVIEGNTRVQIYREFLEEKLSGNWDYINAIVYDNLPKEVIHSIRLQAHLVGPRAWKPYAKAKYVATLYHDEELSINEIISYCGGSKKDILQMIRAYDDMENYYRPQLEDDDIFDERKYSYFAELESNGLRALSDNGYTKKDFAKWVIDGNIDKANSSRFLGQIFANKDATKIFFESNVTDAKKCLDVQDANSAVKDAELITLATALSKKIAELTYPKIMGLSEENSEEYDSLYNTMCDLDQLIINIDKMRNSDA